MIKLAQFDSLSECMKLAQNHKTSSFMLEQVYKRYNEESCGQNDVLEFYLAKNPNTPSEIKRNLLIDYPDFDDFVDKMFQEQ